MQMSSFLFDFKVNTYTNPACYAMKHTHTHTPTWTMSKIYDTKTLHTHTQKKLLVKSIKSSQSQPSMYTCTIKIISSYMLT